MSLASVPNESLASMLRVEPMRDGEFAARLEDFWGGSLDADALARAALAAAQSCEAMELHCLHASPLRSAAPGAPLTLRVERLGQERVARRVVRVLDEEVVCQVVASFIAPDDGVAYQDVRPQQGLPDPEGLPSTLEQARSEGWPEEYARGPIEFRRALPLRWPEAAGVASGVHVEWVRPRAALPHDSRLHMAALVFLSAFYPHWPFARRVGPGFAYDRFRVLDHALWVHRPARWDDWWLLESSTEVAHAGRALSRRSLYARDGTLLASTSQEALVAVS
jgi:acyl-CoA thioesterase-2